MRILNHKIVVLMLAIIMGFSYSGNSIAAEKKDKSARRAAQMMQKMQQDMQAEKAAMQAQFEVQKKELEDKNKTQDEQLQKVTMSSSRKLKSLESDLNLANTEKATLAQKQQATQVQLDEAQKNLSELKLQYSQAQADLKFNDNQRKTLSTNLAQTSKTLSSCEDKNAKLYQFGTDLVKIYDKPSTYQAIMREEPFFQLKRVELENILQEKQDQLDDARMAVNK